MQVGQHEAPQRSEPDGRRDGMVGGADDEQVAVAHLVRVRRGGERLGGPSRERAVARQQCARGVEDRHRVEVDRQRMQPRQRERRRQRGAAHGAGRGADVGRARDNAGVTFTRIAWLVTVLACILTCIALLLSGYQGYAAVFLAVGACAAINLT